MLTKFASFENAEILEVKSSDTQQKTASFETLSDFHDYRESDGYTYIRIRAISSRVNKNHDAWPSIELAGGKDVWDDINSKHQSSEGGFTVEANSKNKRGFSTFVGKPFFVDHNNSDPKRTRGAIVDSKLNILDHKTAAENDEYWGGKDVDPEHLPPVEIELLIEADTKSFPLLGKALISGDLDGFSMGTDCDFSICSHCKNKASNPDEFCSHIKMKGAEHDYKLADGSRTSKKSYENCHGLNFFEISAVFDPADETALAKDVRTAARLAAPIICPYCHGAGCPACGNSGQVDAGQGSDGNYMLDSDQVNVGQPVFNDFEGPAIRNDNYSPGNIRAPHLTLDPEELRRRFPNLPAPRQGSYLSSLRQADNPEPQNMHTKAPEEVDTLREEKICPICGSDYNGDKCSICGYDTPPEQFQNPDLHKDTELNPAEDAQIDTQQLSEQPGNPVAQPQAQEDGSTPDTYLNARNRQTAASLNSEMRWIPKETKLAGPKGEEPDEIVISDQTTPITSAFKTASQLIEEVKRNKENKMSNTNRVAAEPADSSGKADNRVDVEGVGGFADASAEQASKADAQTDPEGKGGIIQDSNAEASKPDSTESITQTSDNAGFQPGGATGDSTKTFDNSNEPESAVTDKVFPTAAKRGTEPADPVGKAEDRIDVEQPPHDQTGDGTKTWNGTSGNGVTRQQDPVTDKPTQSGGVTSRVSLAALRLADMEVELGLISKDQKYNRLAQLDQLDDAEVIAEQRALSRVKTAGLSKTVTSATRLPSFKRVASESTPEPQKVDDSLIDSALFG